MIKRRRGIYNETEINFNEKTVGEKRIIVDYLNKSSNLQYFFIT
jgi:hypothetical protein